MAEFPYERLTVLTLPRENIYGVDDVLNDFEKLDLWSNRLDSEYPLDDINYCYGEAKKTHPFHKISKLYGKRKNVFCFIATLRNDEYRALILRSISDRSSNNLKVIEDFTKKMKAYLNKTAKGEFEAVQILNDDFLEGFFSGYHANHPGHLRNIHENLSVNTIDPEKTLETSAYFSRTTALMHAEKSELKKVKVFAHGERIMNIFKGENGKRNYVYTATQAVLELEIGWRAKNSLGKELACVAKLQISRGEVFFKEMKVHGDQTNWKLTYDNLPELTKQNTSVVVKNKSIPDLLAKLLKNKTIELRTRVNDGEVHSAKEVTSQTVPIIPVNVAHDLRKAVDDLEQLQLSKESTSFSNQSNSEAMNQQTSVASPSPAIQSNIFNCLSEETLTLVTKCKQPDNENALKYSPFQELFKDFEKLDFSMGPFDPNDKLNYGKDEKATPFFKILNYYASSKDLFILVCALHDDNERVKIINIVKRKCGTNLGAVSTFERNMNTYLDRVFRGSSYAGERMGEKFGEGMLAYFTVYDVKDKRYRRRVNVNLHINIRDSGKKILRISDYFHRSTPTSNLDHTELTSVQIYVRGQKMATVTKRVTGQKNYVYTKLVEVEMQIKWKAMESGDSTMDCRKKIECLVVLMIKNGFVRISKATLDGQAVEAINILELAKQNDKICFWNKSLYDTMMTSISEEVNKKAYLMLILQDEKERMSKTSSDPEATRELTNMDLSKQNFESGESVENRDPENTKQSELVDDVVAEAFLKAVVEDLTAETINYEQRCVGAIAAGIQPTLESVESEKDVAAGLENDASLNVPIMEELVME